jgi:predicted transcriptional regulator
MPKRRNKMTADVKPLKKYTGVSHVEFFNKIKDFLQEYKTIKEIREATQLGYTTVITRLRLLEDYKLIISKCILTEKARGTTKAYKLK